MFKNHVKNEKEKLNIWSHCFYLCHKDSETVNICPSSYINLLLKKKHIFPFSQILPKAKIEYVTGTIFLITYTM